MQPGAQRRFRKHRCEVTDKMGNNRQGRRSPGRIGGARGSQGAGKSARRIPASERRRRRRKRLIRALTAWAVCIFLVILIAWGTVNLISYLTTAKKRQLREQGIEKLESGDYAGAVGAFDEALEKSGKKAEEFNRDVLLYRAEAEFMLKDYGAALHTYDLLLEIDRNHPEYLYLQAVCYARQGDGISAEEKYEAALAADNKKDSPAAGRLSALLAVGGAFMDQEQYDKALALYESAVAGGMDHGEIYNQMGLCQMASQDYQSAYDSFDKGISAASAAAAEAGKEKASSDKTSKKGEEEKPSQSEKGSSLTDQHTRLLREITYNRAVACEYLQEYDKALKLFEDFVAQFGPDEAAEHEITFLKTR